MPIPHYPDAEIVFCDVDNVLYDGNLGIDLAKRLARGFKALKALTTTTAALVKYRAGRAPVDDILTAAIRLFEGEPAETLAPRVQEATRRHCLDNLFVETEQLLRRYAGAGVPVVIFSSAPQPAVAAIAEEVGAAFPEGTSVELDARGCLTDRPIRPLPHGEGKVEVAERACAQSGKSLDAAAYYADGQSDIPLLRRVRHAVCVNGSKQTIVVARQRGWPICETAIRRR